VFLFLEAVHKRRVSISLPDQQGEGS